MLQRLWKRLKVARKIPLGPASLVIRFERAVSIKKVRTVPAFAAPFAAFAAPSPPHLKPSCDAVANEHPVRRMRATAATDESTTQDLALIVGAGPGLGVALARQLAADGSKLALASRNANRLELLASQLRTLGASVDSYGCDATNELSVDALFQQLVQQQGVPSLVVYALQEFVPGRTVDIEVPAFESSWRHNCFGAFLVARAAARAMSDAGRGTIVLVGSTSSLIGREDHLNLAVGKFGQRALAQVLAREMWSKGVHVAHLMIDAYFSDRGRPFQPDRGR